jgi:hypothetical protein
MFVATVGLMPYKKSPTFDFSSSKVDVPNHRAMRGGITLFKTGPVEFQAYGGSEHWDGFPNDRADYFFGGVRLRIPF